VDVSHRLALIGQYPARSGMIAAMTAVAICAALDDITTSAASGMGAAIRRKADPAIFALDLPADS
jgi:hypothetical protein